jgi:hypothetical protein
MHSRPKSHAGSAMTRHLHLLLGTLLVGLGFVFSDKQSFPFPWALLPACGTLLLISGVADSSDCKPAIQRILESPIFVQTGKISFSLYLWHWPVCVLFRWTTGLETALEVSLALITTFVMANLSFYFIEKTIRTNQWIANRPNWRVVSAGIAAIGVFFFLSDAIFQSQSALSLSVTKDKKTWYPFPWPNETDNGQPKIFAGRKLFAVGDSHAWAYSTMLQMLSDEYGVEIKMFPTGACGIANLLRPGMLANEECVKHTEKIITELEVLASPGDILFLASLRMNRFGDQHALFSDKRTADAQFGEKSFSDRKAALQETKDFLKRFEKSQVHIVIDAPKPIFKSPPFRCSDWFNRSNPVCRSGFELDRGVLLEHRKPVMKSLEILAEEFPCLIVWDPFPILCETGTCSAFDDNRPLFFDGDHLSAHGNRVLYPSFKFMVKKIWKTGTN